MTDETSLPIDDIALLDEIDEIFRLKLRDAQQEGLTVDGLTTMTIPAGVASGRRLRLKGKGIAPRGDKDKRGDQYVSLKIVPPEATQLSDQARTIVETLSAQLEADAVDPRAQAPWLADA